MFEETQISSLCGQIQIVFSTYILQMKYSDLYLPEFLSPKMIENLRAHQLSAQESLIHLQATVKEGPHRAT